MLNAPEGLTEPTTEPSALPAAADFPAIARVAVFRILVAGPQAGHTGAADAAVGEAVIAPGLFQGV